MELKDMTVAQIEERKAAIAVELDNEGADYDALESEVRALNTELEARKQAETQKAEIRSMVAEGSGEVITPAKTEERKNMTNAEVRKTDEYAVAYLRAITTGKDTEVRSLLTENVSGEIPVPELLDNEIRNAWEDHKLMSLVKHTFYKGNVKVGFELSATDAFIHVEGAAVSSDSEEVLTIGTVELKAETIKKWITVSDEAIEGTTIDTIGYLYRELAHKIVEKAEEVLIGKIDNAPATSSQTAAGVPVYKYGIDQTTILTAVSQLSASAKDLNVAMNRQTYALFAAVALQANYAIDVFDGLKDKVVFTDKLPAYTAASEDDTYAIVGDFGYGAQANFPNGDDVKIIYDNLSLAEQDLVKLVGKQYVGMDVVAPNAFVKITKPASA